MKKNLKITIEVTVHAPVTENEMLHFMEALTEQITDTMETTEYVMSTTKYNVSIKVLPES